MLLSTLLACVHWMKLFKRGVTTNKTIYRTSLAINPILKIFSIFYTNCVVVKMCPFIRIG